MTEEKLNIWNHFQALSESLQANFAVLDGARDNLTRGMARETLISNVLERHLPRKVVLGNGEIVDCQKYVSTPVDIILYRDDVPIFNLGGGANQYLVEGVYATIEVKSNLTSSELERALNQVASVKRAHRMHDTDGMRQWYKKYYPDQLDMLSRTPGVAPTTIFAYRGISTKLLMEKIEMQSELYQPDFVCVLGKGAFQRKHQSDSESTYEIVAKPNDSLLAFVFFLTKQITNWKQQYTWDWYFRSQYYLEGT